MTAPGVRATKVLGSGFSRVLAPPWRRPLRQAQRGSSPAKRAVLPRRRRRPAGEHLCPNSGQWLAQVQGQRFICKRLHAGRVVKNVHSECALANRLRRNRASRPKKRERKGTCRLIRHGFVLNAYAAGVCSSA